MFLLGDREVGSQAINRYLALGIILFYRHRLYVGGGVLKLINYDNPGISMTCVVGVESLN